MTTTTAAPGGLPHDIYPNAFAPIDPRQATTVLAARLRRARQFNEELADYFYERSLLEDAYVKGLLRLTKHPLAATLNGPGEDLASLNKLKDVLERELAEIAGSHTTFQRRMLEEVEVPLRNKANGQDWVRLKQYDATLVQTLKDWEDAESRATKSAIKLSSGSGNPKKLVALQQKAAEDAEAFDRAKEVYASEAPAVFAAYQAVDFDRLVFAGEAVARFEAAQSDHARERMEIAEKGMVASLSFEAAEDVQAFALRHGSTRAITRGSAPIDQTQQRSAVPTNGAPHEPPGASLATEPVLPATAVVPPSPSRETAPIIRRQPSIRSSSRTSHEGRAASVRSTSTDHTFSISRSDRLKSRFSTFLGSGRGSKNQTPPFQPSPSSQNLALATIASQAPANRQPGSITFESPVNMASPQLSPAPASEDDHLSTLSPSDRANLGGASGPTKRSSFLPSLVNRRKASKSEPTAPDRSLSASWAGRSGSMGDMPPPPVPTRPSNGTNNSNVPTLQMSRDDALDAINEDRTRDRMSLLESQGGGPIIDAEGFTVPPANHDKKPWEAPSSEDRTSGAVAAPGVRAGASLLEDDEDARDSAAGAPAPLPAPFAIQPTATPQESPQERDAALQKVKSTLLFSGGPQRRQTGNRGRRSDTSRASTFNPMPDDMPSPQVPSQQRNLDISTASAALAGGPLSNSPTQLVTPTLPSPSPGPALASPPTASVGSRANSMLSTSSSVQRHLATAIADPFATIDSSSGAGPRAAIVETVNVLMKGGVIQRTMVTGELSLLLNASTQPTASKAMRLKVLGAEGFAKVAPNPEILAPVVGGDVGEYEVQPTAWSAADGRTSTLALKYQVLAEGSDGSRFTPLQVLPQWKCEPMQTSMLLTYSANPLCDLMASPPSLEASPFEEPQPQAKLENVALTAQLSSHVSTFQSKPDGSWQPSVPDRGQGRMVWALDDIPLTSSGQAVKKVLTRFLHGKEGVSSVSPVGLRWVVKGRLITGVGLEVLPSPDPEDAGPKLEDVTKTTVSGRYLAA